MPSYFPHIEVMKEVERKNQLQKSTLPFQSPDGAGRLVEKIEKLESQIKLLTDRLSKVEERLDVE